MQSNKVLTMAISLVAGVAVVTAAFLAGSRGGDKPALAQEVGDRGISVSGHGEVLIKPDMAEINLGVSVLDETVVAARDRAAASMDKIIASLKANGIQDEDIQTTGFSIQPEYDYSSNSPVLKGYRVLNTVSAKVRAIDSAGKAIDDAVTAGGNDTVVNMISFTVSDDKAAIRQARERAMADAREKAGQLATLASVTLGDPMAISESGGFMPPPMFYGVKGGEFAAADSTAILPGQLTVSVDVTVTYGIS